MSRNEITSIEKDLIYLVSCAVNDQAPSAERYAAMDDDAVFQAASKHMLSAAVAFALERIIPLPYHWKEARGKVFRQQALFNVERGKLLRFFEENGIWYLPLKGIILRERYPKAAMREMSDNDILIDPTKRQQIKSYMEQEGYSCTEYGNTHHDVYDKLPLSFELHSALFKHRDFPVIHDYFADIKDRLIKDGGNLYGYHMTHEDYYLYLVCHMYKHYSKAGTGLRSLLDVYVYQHSFGQTLDWDYLGGELDKLGVREFEERTRTLAGKLFSGDPLTDSESDELAYYLKSNCYGTRDNLTEHELHNDDSRKAKSRYLLRRFFPDKEFLEVYYPVVYRHRILYPLLVVYRPFKGIATKRKQLYSEYKSVKNFKKKQ